MPSATEPAAQIPTLNLPRSHFAALAPASFLAAHLTQDPPTRPSGRAPAETRPPHIHASSLTHAAGSALVRVGGTAVVAGITAETLLESEAADVPGADLPEQERIARLGLLVPHVELGTGCAPSHVGGGAPGAEAQGLGVRVLRLLHSSGIVRLDDLSIRRGDARSSGGSSDAAMDTATDADATDAALAQSPHDVVAYWTLYIDVAVLYLDGATALLDAVWAAVLAALRDLRLPRAWWDADREAVLCADRGDAPRRLELRARPFVCSSAVFVVPRDVVLAVIQGQQEHAAAKDQAGKTFVLADPDGLEDEVCSETLSVVIDCSVRGKARVFGIMKTGGFSIGLEEMPSLVKAAEARWNDWDSALP